MRGLKLTLSLLLIAAMLIACAPGADETPQPVEEPTAIVEGTQEPEPESPEVITDAEFDWRQFEGSEITVLLNEHPWLEGLRSVGIEQFEEKTGIKVNLQPFAEDLYWDKMEMAVRSDVPVADVFFYSMDGAGFSQYKAGKVTPLTPFIEDPVMTSPDYNFADFPKGFLDSAIYDDGNLYAIPATFEAYIVFYNKSVINEYLDGKLPTTMDELTAAAKLVTEKSGGEVYGSVVRGVRSLGVIDLMVGFVTNAWGTEEAPLPYNVFFDGDWNVPRANDPRICEGLNDYAELMQAGPINIQAMDWYDAIQLFNQGKAAFFVDASLFGPQLEADNILADNVGYMTLPVTNQTAESGSITTHWMWGLGIPSNSENKGPAWYFIQWATSPEIEPLIGTKTGGAARLSTWANETYSSTLNPEYVKVVNEAMATSRPAAIFYDGDAQIALPIIDATHAIYSGEDPVIACENLQKEIQDLIP